MKRLLPILVLALLWACPAWADKLPVAVGIEPMKYFVDRIGGDLVETTVMVPAGSDPHTYEPKPSQMRAISSAALYFALGLEFEEAWVPRFQAANPRLKVVRADFGIRKLPMAEHHHHGGEGAAHEEHHGGHAEADDPHVWTAPPLVKFIAEHILESLSEADPANAVTYRHNEADFLRELDQLDAEIRAALKGVPKNRRTFLVFHPSWGYFAQTYGLTQEAVEIEGKEPGPKELAHMVEEARKDGITVVFVQPQFSQRTAETIARAIGGTVAVADPLAGNWAENLREAAKAFRASMKK